MPKQDEMGDGLEGNGQGATAPRKGGPDEVTPAAALVEHISGLAILFHDERQEAFARVTDPLSAPETLAVTSRHFSLWIGHVAHRDLGRVPSARSRADAAAMLETIARYGDGSGRHGFTGATFVRTARVGSRFVIDLANDAGEVVEIDRSGWRVVASSSDLRFRRPRAMQPLPTPQRGGRIDGLRDYINIESDSDFLLLVSWLVAAMRSSGPFPILGLVSEQGSGKSTATRLIRRLVDPNAAPLRALPRDERDLAIMANNGWLLAFDNISGLSDRMSDAFCRLATGGGFSVRALFTDADEAIFDAQRPIILNGIDDLGTRPDLGERCIVLNLRAIAEHERRDERGLLRDFARDEPLLIGALLDVLVAVIRAEGSETPQRLPRMADFALVGVAVARARGLDAGKFLDAFAKNSLVTHATAIESDPIAAAVIELLLRPRFAAGWVGTPTQLLAALRTIANEETTRSRSWPRQPNHLTNRLRRLKPSLARVGVVFEERRGREREIALSRRVESPTPSTSPSFECALASMTSVASMPATTRTASPPRFDLT